MAVVETTVEIRELLVALCRRYAFREVAYLIGGGATGLALNQRDLARLQQLCAYGQRLLELDAEDLANADAAVGANTDTTFAILVGSELVPEHLVARGRRSHLRRGPDAAEDDALVSLHATYRLLLEVIRIRWQRYDTLWLVAVAHTAAEYAPLLAWQPLLGHAGDPVRLHTDRAFIGPGSRWGHPGDPDCPRPNSEKAAGARALRVATEPPSGWQSYLDRQHTHVAHALAGCATDCVNPCTVITQFADRDRARLREACRIALAYRGCALVRLRHRAPVGHGFGVPSRDQVLGAWERSRTGIAKRGGIGEAALIEDGFPLPGLPSLFSAIAGVPLEPDTLIRDTMTEIISTLDPDEMVIADR